MEIPDEETKTDDDTLAGRDLMRRVKEGTMEEPPGGLQDSGEIVNPNLVVDRKHLVDGTTGGGQGNLNKDKGV